MIVYLHKQGHDYTLRYDFLEYWRPDLAKIVRLQSYESLFQAERLSLCTYIFSDIERLDPDEQEMAARIYEELAVADPDGIRLNHPLHSRRRFGLLRSLRDAGMNAFDAYRAGDDPRPKRFPVFVRDENGHDGPVSGLIPDQTSLEDWLLRFRNSGRSLDKYLAVEFLDTSDEGGGFTKFGAYMVNGEIIHQHVLFDNQWVVKFGDGQSDSPERVAFEREYAELQPHRDQLEAVFAMAGIDYGRIDYAIHENRVQTFEINTNPSVVPTRDAEDARTANRMRFIDQFGSALSGLDEGIRGEIDVEPSRPTPLSQAMRSLYHDVRQRMRFK